MFGDAAKRGRNCASSEGVKNIQAESGIVDEPFERAR